MFSAQAGILARSRLAKITRITFASLCLRLFAVTNVPSFYLNSRCNGTGAVYFHICEGSRNDKTTDNNFNQLATGLFLIDENKCQHFLIYFCTVDCRKIKIKTHLLLISVQIFPPVSDYLYTTDAKFFVLDYHQRLKSALFFSHPKFASCSDSLA